MTTTLPAFTRCSGDVVAELIMTRTAYQGALVLVEGVSDSRFLSRHIASSLAQIVICGGKTIALDAITRLQATSLAGYVAVVDLDFDHYLGCGRQTHVIVTDTHDVETLLLSVRLSTTIAELGDGTKIASFEMSAHRSIAESVLERAAHFARLRYLNEVSPAFNISFESVSLWKYFNVATWTLNEIQLRIDFAILTGLSTSQLESLLLTVPELRTWRDVHGHDCLNILSIGLRNTLGNGKQISPSNLAAALRLAFSEQDFQCTNIYSELRLWESASGTRLFERATER